MRADRVGLCGQSSGGHLAMLAAMRPRRCALCLDPDARAPTDASVAAVAMVWPVINPLSRYRHARRALRQRHPAGLGRQHPVPPRPVLEDRGGDGRGQPGAGAGNRGAGADPARAVAAGAAGDNAHDYRDPDSPVELNEPERFAGAYRRAGGTIEMVSVPYATRADDSHEPVKTFLLAQLTA